MPAAPNYLHKGENGKIDDLGEEHETEEDKGVRHCHIQNQAEPRALPARKRPGTATSSSRVEPQALLATKRPLAAGVGRAARSVAHDVASFVEQRQLGFCEA